MGVEAELGFEPYWGIAMRRTVWTVFFVVALQGLGVASSAQASPEDANAPAHVSVASTASPSTGSRESDRSRPTMQAEAVRAPVRNPSQVLSRTFSSPRPVQIYWFFGGR